MKKDSIFLVSCFIKNLEQIDLLHNLCQKIKEDGFEYIITSHSTIPDHIISNSRATFYDSNNHLIPLENRDLTKRGKFWISTDSFTIESPFFMHGGQPCYSQAHLDLVYNGLLSSRRLGYQCAHFITYDSTYDPIDIKERTEKITSGSVDFIGFKKDERILADNWSVNPNSVDLSELLVNSDTMTERLDNLIYDDCKYLEIYLLKNIRKDIRDHEWDDPKIGSYVSPLKAKKGEWALFYNDGINLFVQNNSSNSIKLTYYTAHKKVQYELNSNNYILLKIYEENSFGVFVLKFNDEMIATLDLNPENERKFWIESTNFTKF